MLVQGSGFKVKDGMTNLIPYTMNLKPLFSGIEYPVPRRDKEFKITKRRKKMSIQPEGEDLRKAVKWISEERKYNPEAKPIQLVEEACLKFDLSPKDADYLTNFVLNEI
jgi:hypothetical protein